MITKASMVIACAAVFCVTARSAQKIVIPAVKHTAPITIDGQIVDAEWKGIPKLEGLVDNLTGEAAPDAATFWITYDDVNIYVAARLAARDPKLIRAAQYQINSNLSGDDYVEFDLDLSGSGRDFSSFRVNPRGATTTILAGGRANKREWAGEIQAAAKVTPSGWQAEMRIPWSALPLPSAGPRDVRVNFRRFVASTNRLFAAVYRIAGSVANLPVWQGLSIPKGGAKQPILLLPYGYLGYDPSQGRIIDSGLDLKAPLTDKMQVVASVNPDFRNVENQILSLDFSHFARIPGESRPFFLEGSQYEGTAIFSSQLIPQFDVGVNAYGKLDDKTTIGFLNTIQYGLANDSLLNLTATPDATTSERLGVTESDTLGDHNEAFQATYRKGWGAWQLNASNSESFDTYAGHGDNSAVTGVFRQNGVFAVASLNRITPNFAPSLGFVQETDLEGLRSFFDYDRPWNHGAWREGEFDVSYLAYDHVNGSDYRRDASFGGSGVLRNGLFFAAGEDTDQFEGVDEHLTTVQLGYPQGDSYNNASAAYAWGRQENAEYESLTLVSSRRPLSKLQLTGSYQIVNYLGVTDQFIGSGSYDLGHEQAINGRFTEQSGRLGGYLSYSRSNNLGAEYYLILGDPSSTTFHFSLLLKVVVPFQIKT